MQKIVNVAEVAGKDWTFIKKFYDDQSLDWKFFSANPINMVERLIRRPNIGRYRACLQSCLSLSSDKDVVISHLPRMTHWQSLFMKSLGRNNRHLAFSFNFTDLPNSKLIKAMTKSLERVEKVVVYSSFERELYQRLFKLPPDKVEFLHWAMETPKVDELFSPVSGEYFCSVGGEGRDYLTLIEAFRKLKHLTLVIVTRPGRLDGICIPSNVKVYYNLSGDKFWGVVNASLAMIMTLKNSETACGHISLVGAMKLGVPTISTFSEGTSDYVVNGQNAKLVSPLNIDELVGAVNEINENRSLAKSIAEKGLMFSEENCELKSWVNYVSGFLKNAP